MVSLTKEDFIAKRKHCFCIAACFLLLVTPYFDVTCTCVTSNMWNVTFSVRIKVCRTYCHLILYQTNICRDRWSYPWLVLLLFTVWNCLREAEFCARGRVLCALVMLQTLPDQHSHHYNVKTDITLALHLGCRIYMCSLNITSQILCIRQDHLCCHMSRVTCALMSISNSNIINTSQLSSLIHTKPFPWKNEPPKHDPITTVKDISFLSDWESTFWHCTICPLLPGNADLFIFKPFFTDLT